MKQPIAFDFDGTITLKNEYPNCGELRPGIDDCIRQLALLGHPIIIYTCRDVKTHDQLEAYNMMVQYLQEQGIVYTCINSNAQPSGRFNPTKPYAAIYVDDCALGWNPDWNGLDIYNLIMKYFNKNTINKL